MAEELDEPFDVRPTRRWGILISIAAVAVIAWALYSAWVFTEQRKLIAEQKRLQLVLVERSLPVFDALRPTALDLRESRPELAAALRRADRLVRELRPLARESRPLVRELRPLARESRPLVRELRPLAQELQPLVRDLHPLVRDAHPLVRELRMIDLRGVLSTTGEAARQAATDQRLARALEATIDVLSETRGRDLPRRAARAAGRVDRDLPRIVRSQAEALALLRRSLQVQEEALVHVRSLDNKTGGPAPGSGGSPVPPGGGQPRPTSANSPSSAAPGR